MSCIANNYQLFEEHPLLAQVPEEIREELMKNVLENPDYNPSISAPFLPVKRIDLHAIPKEHQIEKILWVFKQCTTFVQELTLPGNCLSAIKDFDTITFSKIKNPFDALCFCMNLVTSFLRTIPFIRGIIPLDDTRWASPFISLKVLKLKGINHKEKIIGKESLASDSLYHLAKICPNVEELRLEDCIEVTSIPEGFSRLKSLSVINRAETPRYWANLAGLAIGYGSTRRKDHVSNRTLEQLAKTSPALERLHFHDCSSLDTIPGTQFPQLKSFIRTKTASYNDCPPWEVNANLEVLMLPDTPEQYIPALDKGSVKLLEVELAFGQSCLEVLTRFSNIQLLVATSYHEPAVSELPAGRLVVFFWKSHFLSDSSKGRPLYLFGDREGRKAGVTYIKEIELGVLNAVELWLGIEHEMRFTVGEDGGLDEITLFRKNSKTL